MTVLTVDGVRLAIGDGRSLIVDGFALAAGERLVLFGPNGAGKTTLLRRIAGTLQPGRRDEPGSVVAGTVAYLPQRPYLFRGSAGWNLDLGLDPEGRARARRLAASLGVAGLLQRPARSLSGGERQRLALARILSVAADVVLLDEPLAALDARDRVDVGHLVADAIGGRASLIVTHDREEAAVLADDMAVMIDGMVRQRGPVAEVFGLPADDDVAAVVGVGNVLGGPVSRVDGALVAVDAGPIEVWGVGDVAAGQAAKALFGAEAVTIYPEPAPDPGSARNAWPGTVRVVRPAGRLVEVVVDAGVPVAALVTPGSLDALDLQPGVAVTLAVKATAVRVVPG